MGFGGFVLSSLGIPQLFNSTVTRELLLRKMVGKSNFACLSSLHAHNF